MLDFRRASKKKIEGNWNLTNLVKLEENMQMLLLAITIMITAQYICRACVAAMTSMPRRCYQFWRWSLFADYHQYDDQCDNYVRIQWKLWQLSQLWRNHRSLWQAPSVYQLLHCHNEALLETVSCNTWNIHLQKNCKILILKYVVVFIPCSMSYLNLLRVQGVFFNWYPLKS